MSTDERPASRTHAAVPSAHNLKIAGNYGAATKDPSARLSCTPITHVASVHCLAYYIICLLADEVATVTTASVDRGETRNGGSFRRFPGRPDLEFVTHGPFRETFWGPPISRRFFANFNCDVYF